MSSLVFLKKTMPAQPMNGESSLPPAAEIYGRRGILKSELDDDDGLFPNYGGVLSPFPYRMQDMYSRRLYDTEFVMPVLENEYLRATFMPAFGGKLWSLYDKKAERELLVANPVVRPCNLALRNAWTAGGIEWNCGTKGSHHPNTCSLLHTSRTELEDGTPVLRMYEYERITRITYQMDFFLPDGSKLLFARIRMVNERDFVQPVYWWSNIAVPELDGARVIAPVDESYTIVNGILVKIPVPMYKDTDITYPVNQSHSVDFFWKVPDKERKYFAQVDKNGYGLVQTSTSRLIGRKLFVWGQGPGGKRWQQYLTDDDCKTRYVEIQAGLSRTQYESLPMPPNTAWEWLEGYGAINVSPSEAHGEWHGAIDATARELDGIISAEKMEEILVSTKKVAKSPAKETILRGSGWGALENYSRSKTGDKPLSPHLDFGQTGAEQEQWKELLDTGSFGSHSPLEVPPSWMLAEEWTEMMKKAADGPDRYNWYTQLQYGMTLFAEGKFEDARKRIERSYSLSPSPWALYCLGQLARVIEGNREDCAVMALQASKMKPDDPSLVKEAAKALARVEKWGLLKDFFDSLPEDIRRIPRLMMYRARAELMTGNLETAEKLLYEDGGIVVADIREGEESVTELWYDIEKMKAEREGRTFDRQAVTPPSIFDFRMAADR